ncbi:M20/M25/M40 family metallo-hydrolase [Humibacter ginsenosidimutans]|uniref:M20/M25/M40 family metallo-hydrolase n=1 Tax=Humibacter ginsenosidimutans TaxID=2599293 RepID=A0A5B8M019_9MICO|nr:M20/M25/M40 family metallo-hydrolase [Humibacter ginsenosidimutans]QDZ13723.1 M20/M25/M40 family metallo-hydrolase [Humibacter ginsenosidimutans]
MTTPNETTDGVGSPGAEHHLDETARIARDLIRIDTTNWGEGRAKGEADAAAYVSEHLASLGLHPRTYESRPDRTTVVARVAGRDRSKPALVVHGHLDVVPADPSDWTFDPFAGEIHDGLLWGRGAVDMKNMDAMILTAVGDILKAGEAPERDLVIAFFADEEDGGLFGSHFMVDEHPDVFDGATEAISEVGGYSVDVAGTRAYLLQTGEKSLLWLRLVARGAAAHGSRMVSDNAVTKLAKAIVTIGSHEWPLQLTDTTTQLVDELARLMGVDPVALGPDEVVLRSGTASGFVRATLRTTSNPTLLKAGYKHNVVPERAEALVDIRTLAGDEDDVLLKVRELIDDDVDIEIVHRDIGLEAPFAGPLVTAMKESLIAHDPEAVVLPYLLSGGTDNKALKRLDITGYGFAPLKLPADVDFPAMFHGVDERVPLDSLVFGRTVLRHLLSTY